MDSFLDRANRPKDQPEQSDNPPRVENACERAGPEKTGRTGNNASDNRHKCKAAAAHPEEKSDRFPNRSRTQRKPGLMPFRLDLARASPNNPENPASEH